MTRYLDKDLKGYMEDDYILDILNESPDCDNFASQRWLKEMPAKRMIYSDLYGKLLNSKGKRILDVGGDFSSLSKILLKNHEYELIDIMVHGGKEDIKEYEKKYGTFWVGTDWYSFNVEKKYDVIICNDLFPNADQRVEFFIEKFKPYCEKLILTLTAYDTDRFYVVNRVDAEEQLTIKPWDSYQIDMILSRVVEEYNPIGEIIKLKDSLYSNSRKVYKLIL